MHAYMFDCSFIYFCLRSSHKPKSNPSCPMSFPLCAGLQQLSGEIQQAYGDNSGPEPFSNIAMPVCLAIAIAYLVFGGIIFDANPIFRPSAANESLVAQQARRNKELQYHVPRARDAWHAIQIFSTLGLFASFMVIVWCNTYPTVDCDENGYCQEVADEYSDSGMEVLCLYFSLFWAAILVAILHRLGTEVFSGGSSNFLTGMFCGGLILLGCFFFGCFFFFAPFTVRLCIPSFAGAVQLPYVLLFLTISITSILQIVEKWGGAALRQGSSDEGTYTFSYISLTLAIFYGAFGGCVWYLHEAIVDAVFVGKDDKTIRDAYVGEDDKSIGDAVSESGSYGDTYASAADTTIRTKEQNNRPTSERRSPRGGGGDDNTAVVSTTVTETTAPIKNTRKQKTMPSLDEDASDGSYELV